MKAKNLRFFSRIPVATVLWKVERVWARMIEEVSKGWGIGDDEAVGVWSII